MNAPPPPDTSARDQSLVKIIDIFREISAIPRLSHHEAALRSWIIKWAKKRGFSTQKDAVGNVVVRVPATPGWEESPSVVLQSHMDMVGEKEPRVAHDFMKDPIAVYQEGDWLRAHGTTLGADDGIGVALSLYAAVDPSLNHPAMELLFTVDEESGLTGAAKLEKKLIKSRYLINIDSEDEGILINGCAGGSSANIQLTPPTPSDRPTEIDRRIETLNRTGVAPNSPLRVAGDEYHPFILKIGGMPGGHSGVDINKARGNAIVSLGALLRALYRAHPLVVGALGGGRAHNAIPREASAALYIPVQYVAQIQSLVARYQSQLRAEHAHQLGGASDATLTVTLSEAVHSNAFLHTSGHTKALLNLLAGLPDGVQRIIQESTTPLLSANVACVGHQGRADTILLSMRSTSGSALKELEHRVKGVVAKEGAECRISEQYPAWEPAGSSALSEHCRGSYLKTFQKPLSVEIIHAGLEPAVIAKCIPELDMVSIGPTMQYPHSPQERLSLSSTAKLYRFLCTILSDWKEMR